MRPSVGHVSRPPFLSFIASLRSRKFSPACSRVKDLASRPLGYECHTTAPSRSQNPLLVSNEHVRCLKKPGQRLFVKVIIRQESSNAGAGNVPNSPRTDLPSHEEGRRSHVSKSFSRVMDHLQSNIFIAGQRLNDLTGYSGIEALKQDIKKQEIDVQKRRSDLQQAREGYSTAISQRSASQREVNELLQRKHAWTPNDLERFTALYRSDHANEQSESSAQERLVAAERQAEEATAKLSASILARYHEEQIWSDKIRRMSTWGTWGLMGVNVLLFLVFQIGVEPWRRKRLVKGFEDKVMEALEREGPIGAGKPTTIQISESPLESNLITTTNLSSSQETPLQPPETTTDTEPLYSEPQPIPPSEPQPIPPSEPPTIPPSEPPSDPPTTTILPSQSQSQSQPLLTLKLTLTTFQATLADLFSPRPVQVRRIDLTTIALEGAAAGMALAGIIAIMVLRAR